MDYLQLRLNEHQPVLEYIVIGALVRFKLAMFVNYLLSLYDI